MQIKLFKHAVSLTILLNAGMGLSANSDRYRTGTVNEVAFLEHEIKRDHALVFDWDDTLFPSTYYQNYLKKNFYGYNTEQLRKLSLELSVADDAVYDLLKRALKSKKIFIISNASQKWLEDTSRYYPKSRSLFSFKREKDGFVTVFSAKGYFRNSLPEDPFDRTDYVLTTRGYYPVAPQYRWKIRAFRDVLSKRYSQVTSVGDGLPEQLATYMLPVRSKRHIKWKVHPQISDIVLQAKGFVRSMEPVSEENLPPRPDFLQSVPTVSVQELEENLLKLYEFSESYNLSLKLKKLQSGEVAELNRFALEMYSRRKPKGSVYQDYLGLFHSPEAKSVSSLIFDQTPRWDFSETSDSGHKILTYSATRWDTLNKVPDR